MSCNKCHQADSHDADTWCLACLAWEKLGQELCGAWKAPALRALAADQAVAAARHVRALRILSCSWASGDSARAASLSGLASAAPSRERVPHPPNHPPPGHREAAAEVKEEEEYSEYTEEGESEEDGEGAAPSASAKSAAKVRPEAAPPARDRSPLRRKSSPGAGGKGKPGAKKKKKVKRAGRKHKRLYRSIKDPFRPSHRGLGAGYWDSRGRTDDFKRRRSPTP